MAKNRNGIAPRVTLPPDTYELLRDRERMAALYAEHGSVKDMAAAIGVSRHCAGDHLRRLGIQTTQALVRSGADLEALKDRDKMTELYNQYTYDEIAVMLRCGHTTVRKWVRIHGIPPRQAGLKPGQEPPAPKNGRGNGHVWTPTMEDPKDRAVARIQVSRWRLHILAGACPPGCPDEGICYDRTPAKPDDGRMGCIMYNRLKNMGELRPRDTEPEDPFAYWEERLGAALVEL